MPLVHHCALVYISLMQQYLRLVQQVHRSWQSLIGTSF